MINQTARSSLEVTRSPVQVTSMFYKVQQAGAILSGIAPSPSAEVHHFLTKYKILQISASLPSGPCGQEGCRILMKVVVTPLLRGEFRTRRG